MIGNLLMPELVELIHKRDFDGLREILCGFPPADVAEIFVDLKAADEAICLRMLPRGLAAEVFEYLPLKDQEEVLHALGSEEVSQILNDLAPDDRTRLLEELPATATQKLLNLLNPDERKIATTLLGYPKSSIGRRMRPEYVAVQQNWNVSEVLAHLRREESKREVMNQLYVVDAKGRLVDFVPLRNVVVAAPQTSVLELLVNQRIFLHATDDQETAVTAFKKYDVTILPVVDSQDVLLGVVTVDDILDVAEREATEDIQKLGGVQALEAPYLKTGIFEMVKKRAPWLAVLFLGEMFTSVAMQNYGGEIERVVVLAFFVPLILSSGGNSGSQATSLIIRAMAVRDVLLSDWWRVFRRELASGFLLGIILACVGMARVFLWQFLHFAGPHGYGPHYPLLALTIGISLVCVVLWGSLAGAMLPMFLRFIKLDPAVCSAPFVATLVDVTGIVIFFNVAIFALSGTLLAAPPKGIEQLEYKDTPTVIQRLINLDPDWEVEKMQLNTSNNTVRIEIVESDDFVKHVKSPGCKGPFEIYDHAAPQLWSYPDLLGHHTEIECRLPLVRCKNGGTLKQPMPENLPWADQGKLISGQP
jgi:magnesium transporter